MDGKTLVYDALKPGSKKLPNIDPFHDIEPLIIENFIPVKTNLDAVCLIFPLLSFTKVYLAKFFRFLHSQKFIRKISRDFWLAKVSLAKNSPIKVTEIVF